MKQRRDLWSARDSELLIFLVWLFISKQSNRVARGVKTKETSNDKACRSEIDRQQAQATTHLVFVLLFHCSERPAVAQYALVKYVAVRHCHIGHPY